MPWITLVDNPATRNEEMCKLENMQTTRAIVEIFKNPDL